MRTSASSRFFLRTLGGSVVSAISKSHTHGRKLRLEQGRRHATASLRFDAMARPEVLLSKGWGDRPSARPPPLGGELPSGGTMQPPSIRTTRGLRIALGTTLAGLIAGLMFVAPATAATPLPDPRVVYASDTYVKLQCRFTVTSANYALGTVRGRVTT